MLLDEKWTARFRNEIKKIGAMSFREKREYIWEYYRLPILGTAFVLFIAGSLINTWFINPPKDEFLVIGWSGGYETVENMTKLEQALTVLVNDPEREAVLVDNFISNGDPTYDMALGQRMIAMISTAGLDLFITDKATVEGMAQENLIQPIEGFLETAYSVDAGLRDKLSDKLAEASHVPDGAATEADGDTAAFEETRVFGVNITGCPLFTQLGMIEQELYLCVCVTSEKLETAARALSLFYA